MMGRLQRKRSQQTRNRKKRVGNTNTKQMVAEASKDQRKKFNNSVSGKVGKLGSVGHESKNNLLHSVLAFLKESKSELKKVVWPTKKQTLGSTLVVIVIVGLISLFLGVVDAGLSRFIKVFLG